MALSEAYDNYPLASGCPWFHLYNGFFRGLVISGLGTSATALLHKS